MFKLAILLVAATACVANAGLLASPAYTAPLAYAAALPAPILSPYASSYAYSTGPQITKYAPTAISTSTILKAPLPALAYPAPIVAAPTIVKAPLPALAYPAPIAAPAIIKAPLPALAYPAPIAAPTIIKSAPLLL